MRLGDSEGLSIYTCGATSLGDDMSGEYAEDSRG